MRLSCNLRAIAGRIDWVSVLEIEGKILSHPGSNAAEVYSATSEVVPRSSPPVIGKIVQAPIKMTNDTSAIIVSICFLLCTCYILNSGSQFTSGPPREQCQEKQNSTA